MTGLATIQLTAPNPQEAWASSAEGCNASTITASALWSSNLSTISELCAAPLRHAKAGMRRAATCTLRKFPQRGRLPSGCGFRSHGQVIRAQTIAMIRPPVSR